MQQKFRAKGKKLYFGFVDFEKAFYMVPTEVIRWAMRKLGVEEWQGAILAVDVDNPTVTVWGGEWVAPGIGVLDGARSQGRDWGVFSHWFE